MLHHRYYLIIWLFFVPVILLGQSLPKQALFKPRKFVLPYEGLDVQKPDDGLRGRIWFVYGDRMNLQTYKGASSSKPYKRINFGEAFVVVDEKDGYIRIVIDPKINYRGKISEEAQDYGWVKKENILLWENCLVNPDQGNLYRKAMMLNTLSSFVSLDLADKASSQVEFFYNSDLTQSTGVSSSLFEIFFVYKVDPVHNTVLLGRSSSFSKGDHGTILGWVSKDRIVDWDHRVALEPNWYSEGVGERQKSGIKSRFFSNKSSAQQYLKSGTFDSEFLLWDDDPFTKRKVGDYRRFPVLDGKFSDAIVKVGVMGDINTSHAQISADQMADIQRQFTKAKTSARKINLLFVIDASKSMEPYFQPVSDAIISAMEDINRDYGDKNLYRFGAVAYRDFAEGKFATESVRLTDDYQSITTFLNKVPEESLGKNLYDDDMPEAVNYGIKTALRGTGIRKGETNVLVLVGDCGNHSRSDRTFVSADEILELTNEFSTNILVFQVNRGEDPAFEDFVTQNKALVKELAVKNYAELKKNAELADYKLTYPVIEQDLDNSNFWRLTGGALAGAVLSPPRNQSLAPEKLSSEIEKLIKDLGKRQNELMDALETLVMSGEDLNTIVSTTPPSESPYVSSFPASILLFLDTHGFDSNQLQYVTGKSFQLFTEGYAPLHSTSLKEPLFQPVLLLSLRELAELIRDLETLIIAPDASSIREQFRESWISLVQLHIGNVGRDEIDSWSIEELTEKVFGLPTISDLGKNSLKDLLDPAIVDDYSLNNYINGIQKKTSVLNKIFNQTDYNYNFMSNDITYFWIEQDLLP